MRLVKTVSSSCCLPIVALCRCPEKMFYRNTNLQCVGYKKFQTHCIPTLLHSDLMHLPHQWIAKMIVVGFLRSWTGLIQLQTVFHFGISKFDVFICIYYPGFLVMISLFAWNVAMNVFAFRDVEFQKDKQNAQFSTLK